MTFDEWFEIQPHPAMSEQEIAEMRRDYKYAWDAALKHARPEVERIDAWNGALEEAIAAGQDCFDAGGGWAEAIDAIRTLRETLPQREERQ